jgi:molybdenum cofactor sulfurtransferase
MLISLPPGTTYLDHAGTTLYAKSLVEAISHDLTTNLFGNPHSSSVSSQLSSRRIDNTRVRVLRFLNADPEHFDVVFVANATAAIKLVADAFRDHAEGFQYAYHVDSHTSLVGVRELASPGNHCLVSDNDVETWLSSMKESSLDPHSRMLFGYPGQSNLSGYRPPLAWCSRIYELRKHYNQPIYSLYDAAARLTSAPLDFSNPDNTPDFTALSFYKIFGLPDLGALVVRKECSDIFDHRKFFGGGTVDMIISLGSRWHASKQSSLHSRLEDGTVPFHSIIALDSALSTHSRIFGSMYNISRHTSFLVKRLHEKMSTLRHSTGKRVCRIYGPAKPDYPKRQGPTIAFNLHDAEGNWIGKSEVEKLAAVRNIQLRTGGLCNPGGIASHLELSASELRNNFAAGQRCGDDHDILNGKPTGVIRVSLGAMSNITDTDNLVDFLEEFFVHGRQILPSPPITPPATPGLLPTYHVQSLSVFPIKSCAAFKVPPESPWEVRVEGLAWDREWCLIHQGTGVALSQKKCPRMAMLRPSINLKRRVLSVQYDVAGSSVKSTEISFDANEVTDGLIQGCNSSNRSVTVCGESREVFVSTSVEIAEFFTAALGVPCTLARYRKAAGPSPRARSVSYLENATQSMPGYFPDFSPRPTTTATSLSNESPILLVSQSSVSSLNKSIQATNPSAEPIPADSFRGNIVIAQAPHEQQKPYAEDSWSSVTIGDNDDANTFDILGPCQRCQMVCVDQQSAKRRMEPYSTLAKTRRRNGKVWFGMHLAPVALPSGEENEAGAARKRFIKIGDVVKPHFCN